MVQITQKLDTNSIAIQKKTIRIIRFASPAQEIPQSELDLTMDIEYAG
jgi:hypothetical protein